MKRQNRAFTLIELLVVIAIIAILAAILFPVFAQAKVAAKGAASISNSKQIGTAIVMYSTDYDDRAPLSETNDPGSPLLILGQPMSPWSVMIMPYMKSAAIFQDPLWQPEPNNVTGAQTSTVWQYRTQYGYNYATWAPVTVGTTGWIRDTTSFTQPENPSETVMITIKKARNGQGDWVWTLAGIPAVFMANLIAPPYCNNATGYTAVSPNSICAPAVRWGVGGYTNGTAPPTYEEGLFTGGMAVRKTGQTIVTMGDSSTKAMTPSRVAAGTNWNRNLNYASVVITDQSKYMWDTK